MGPLAVLGGVGGICVACMRWPSNRCRSASLVSRALRAGSDTGDTTARRLASGASRGVLKGLLQTCRDGWFRALSVCCEQL